MGRALPPGASPELVRQVADLAVTPGSGTGVLLVTAPEVTDVTALGTRKDGTSIYRPPNEARYTTTGHLDLEERILRQARKQVPQRVSEGMARRALTGSGLSEEQEDAAVRLLTSATMVSILTAPAGAGKTHTVAAYAQAWTRLTGRRVIGITTAENAARQMTEEGLAEVYNSAAFLGKTKGSDLLRYPVRIGAGDVLVLDESSMISTADLALIMDYADRAGALVVPTGDAFQLGPVEAGGMFGALIAELGAAELSEVMRFDQQWERDASARLREGDFSVVAAYDRRGRIRGGHREAAFDRAAGAWLADHLHGRDTILLAGSNEEAAELARRVQAQLVTMGTVVQPRAPLADGNRAGTGDLIRARLNTRDRRRRAAADQPGRAADRGLAGPGRGGGPQAAGRGLVGPVPGAPLLPRLRRRIAVRGQYPRGAGPDRRHLARAGHRTRCPGSPFTWACPAGARAISRTW